MTFVGYAYITGKPSTKIISKSLTSGTKKHVNMLQSACLISLSELEGINTTCLGPIESVFPAFRITKFTTQQILRLIFVVENPS